MAVFCYLHTKYIYFQQLFFFFSNENGGGKNREGMKSIGFSTLLDLKHKRH